MFSGSTLLALLEYNTLGWWEYIGMNIGADLG